MNKTVEETKKCPSCDKDISLKAKRCPYCRQDLRGWFSRHPILTILLILISSPFWIAILVGFSQGITGSSSQNGGSATATPTPAVTQAEVDDLAQRYYDSHIKMKWFDGQFYGGSLTPEVAKRLMRDCVETFDGKARCEQVIAEKFWIDMTSDWATMSLGNPNDINKTVTGNLTREQWVYGNPIYGATYLYFDNGTLSSYQN
jgi:hypothetical protein